MDEPGLTDKNPFYSRHWRGRLVHLERRGLRAQGIHLNERAYVYLFVYLFETNIYKQKKVPIYSTIEGILHGSQTTTVHLHLVGIHKQYPSPSWPM